MQSKSIPNLLKMLVALLAGAMNVFAFAPFGWWPLCLLSFCILFGLWLRCNRKIAAWCGYLFGVGMFGVGTSWMYVSLYNFGGLPPWLAAMCVAVLVLLMSLWPALAGWLQGCFLAGKTSPLAMTARAILIMPSIWLVCEWLRGWLFSGYPWLTSGYAMLDTYIAGMAPLGGVYLVGLLTLMSAGALLSVVTDVSRANALLSFLLCLIWLGGWQLSNRTWTHAQGEKISVALVQNNVPLTLKWERAQRERIIADYLEQSARHTDVDLVVWPEASVPEYFDLLPKDFHQQIRAHPADFIYGVITRQSDSPHSEHFNSIIAQGERLTLYHKQHLVPFGEFMPFRKVFQPLLARLNIPMSHLTAWQPPQTPLHAAGNYFAASICYEDAFPQIWRKQVPAAGALINVSEDMWFGDSFAPHQRLQMARFRALENGRPMLRAANNGLSSVINWRGGIDVIAPQFVKTVVTATLQPRTGVTPYTQYGELPALILSVLVFALGGLLGRRKLR